LPGLEQKGLVSIPFLVMLNFVGVGSFVAFPCTPSLPQGSPGETAPYTHLVHKALGGRKKNKNVEIL